MLEINLVTFLAVVVNFLIIYVIFKLFFYKPVKNIIENREKSIKEKFSKNQSLMTDAERKFREAEEKFEEAEIRAKKIIKDAEDIAEKMIQEKTIEAKKQTKEIILSAEEQSKSVVESANIYLKSLALKTTGTLSLQILSSIITTDLDFEIIKMFLRELDSIEIYDESGRKLRGLKEIMLSSIPEEKGIVVKTAHEMPQNLKKEIEKQDFILYRETNED